MNLMNSNYRLILFWNIGKLVFEEQNKFDNATSKYSIYFQYKYGMTECFSRKNIILMKKLYFYFPIFNSTLLKLSWEHYIELLKISVCSKRMFYYKLSIFSMGSSFDLANAIGNCIYERI